jgi:hypothetical protein
MFYLLAILIGIVIGQHLQITVSPELSTFLRSSWSSVEAKALPVANSAVQQIKQVAAKSLKSAKLPVEEVA